MAENTIAPGEVEAALERLFEELNQSRQATLGELAAAHEQRAAQLAEAAKRLATVIGENSPRVLDLIDAADAATEQQTLFTMTLKRMDSLSAIKPPSPNQWLVLGRVVDTEGAPLQGITVDITDRQRQLAGKLGSAATNEFGDFAITYQPAPGSGAPGAPVELFLLLRDQQGTSTMTNLPLHIRAGASDYVEIALPTPSRPRRPTRTRRGGPG